MIAERHKWFKPKRVGWGITPIAWQGWVYTAAWVGGMLVPQLLILRMRRPIIGLIWISAVTTALCVDSWFILRRLKKDAARKQPSMKLEPPKRLK